MTMKEKQPKPEKTTKTHRFNDVSYAEARDLAHNLGMSMTTFIEDAIREKIHRVLQDPRYQEIVDERVALRRAEQERHISAQSKGDKPKSPTGMS